MSDDNIRVFQGGKQTTAQTAEKKIPQNDYVLWDKSGEDYYATGFLIFTSAHVAVMRDEGDGAIPVLVLPMDNFKFAELVEDEEETAPF